MNEKIAVFGVLRFPPETMPRVLPHLASFVEATRANDGCIAYDIAEDLSDPGLIRFSELWPSQESLDAHLQAPHIIPWRAAARENGLLERKFTAYEIGGARDI